MRIAYLLAVILFSAGGALGVTPESVDVWINITLAGVDPATVDTSALNATELIERLDKLAVDDQAKYYQLASAYVRSNAELFSDSGVSVFECPVGSYIALSGLCTPCAAGTYSETPRATSVSVCIPCLAGFWSNVSGASNRSVCQACPVGTFSSVTGASSISSCSTCGAGMTSVAGAGGSGGCVCKPGYYRPTAGASTCVACEPGYFCSLEVKYACPGYNADPTLSMSSSLSAASSRYDCFCLAGYHGVAGSVSSCQECPVNSYCTGELITDEYVKNSAVINNCPANSRSDVKSVRLDQCVCLDSYQKEASSPASRGMTVTASPCNCTNTFKCAVAGCTGCQSGVSCTPGSTLTCPQGYVDFVTTVTSAAMSGFITSATWLIAPPGATRIWLRLTDLNTGSASASGNTLKILQCGDPTCEGDTSWVEIGVGGSIALKGYSTGVGYGVVKVIWTARDNLPTFAPFKLEYASEAACAGGGSTLPVTVGAVTYLDTRESQLYPPQIDVSWPLVAWVGDQVTFTEYPGDSKVAVDILLGSATGASATTGYVAGQIGYLRDWMAEGAGVYYVVDLAMPTRNRALHILPVGPRTATVYYAYATSGAVQSFTLSGAVSGTGSPDIVLVVGDTLVMTRLSGTDGIMLLKSYNATSGAYVLADNVVGQSDVSESHTSLTWSTTGVDPGVFYYVRATNMGGVKVGRVLLYAAPGGARCVVCKAGDYCYNGGAVTCPPNSVSPVGSTSVSDCTCSKGFAVATTDLDSYGNSQSVDSGGRHSCVIDSVGGLWCWGANEKGQLGLGNTDSPVLVPTQVPDLADVRNVSLGDDFTCAVVGSSLVVKCWGGNAFGQLGLDSTEAEFRSPGDDALLGIGSIAYSTQALSCGLFSCCAIISKAGAGGITVKVLTCWGRGSSGQLGEGGTSASNRKHVGTGSSTSYKSTGQVSLAFGSYQPVLVTMGGEHACAVMLGGEVYCWGKNDNGAVGAGTTTQYYNPTLVNLGGAAKTVNCYAFVCCAVMKATFQVKCWGKGGDGRTGVGLLDIGKTTASMGVNLQPVAMGTNVYAIDVNVGQVQTCALLSTNAVKCWGIVRGAVIGDNPPLEMSDVLPNVDLLGTRVVLQMSGKGSSTCVVMSDYKAACWGDNALGQLGGTPVSAVMNMTLVGLPAGVEVLKSSGTPQRVACSVCGENTYCPGGASLPQSCPANTYSPLQSFQVSQCQCLAGYKRTAGSGSACTMCFGVQYCIGGTAYQCTGNSATVKNASSEASQCQCAVGYYLSSATGLCTACGQGQYKDTVGNIAACTPCPAGTKGNTTGITSVSGCLPCDAGTSSGSGSWVCSSCGPGFAAAPGSGACLACRPGFFSDGTLAACRPCPAGTFDDLPQTGEPDTCAACSAGTFSSVLNATDIATCRPCPAGTVSVLGSSACVACRPGEYSVEGTSQCVACPGNSTSPNGSAYAGCYCLPGFYKRFAADNVQFTCVACGAGEYSGGGPGALACEKCSAGTSSRAVGAVSAATCGSCNAGQFSAVGSSVCSNCPSWSFSAASGAGSCDNCSLGFYAGSGSTRCTACAPGSYSLVPISGISGCLPCPNGKYCVGGVAAAQAGGAQVVDCPKGTYKDEPGLVSASQCAQCPENFFCPTPVFKGPCPAGTVSPAGSTSQLQCVCQQGFTCSYTRLVNAVVTLQMSASDFDMNAQVKQAFIAAVAAAARTSPSKVSIVKIVPRAGSVRRRRLLSKNKEAVHVVLEIEGGIGEGLGLELEKHLRNAGLQSGGYPAWIEPHHVSVSGAVPV